MSGDSATASRPAVPRRIIRLDSVGSTNTHLLGLLKGGESVGVCVAARRQTAGRGQVGRPWHSPEGSLCISISCEAAAMVASFGAAAAAAEAVREVCGLDARVRWPNDILCDGRKLGGVLVEAGSPQGVLVVGVGLNINVESFPADLQTLATSALLLTGREYPLEAVETALLASFDRLLALGAEHGFSRVLEEWRTLDCTAGSLVRVGENLAEAAGVDDEGRLVAKSGETYHTCISAGQVQWLR